MLSHQSRGTATSTEKNGPDYHDITALGEDLAGNLWLGSYAGAMKLARNGFVTYDVQDGLLAINAIFSDRENGVLQGLCSRRQAHQCLRGREG